MAMVLAAGGEGGDHARCLAHLSQTVSNHSGRNRAEVRLDTAGLDATDHGAERTNMVGAAVMLVSTTARLARS
jgi:hypothetical protein